MISLETKKLLKKARDILSFQKDMGVAEIALTPEIEKFLGGSATEPQPNQIRPAKPSSSPRSNHPDSLFSPAPESALNLPLTEIYQDIEGCSKCPLHKDRKQIVPGCGPAGAKLFIIEDQVYRRKPQRYRTGE